MNLVSYISQRRIQNEKKTLEITVKNSHELCKSEKMTDGRQMKNIINVNVSTHTETFRRTTAHHAGTTHSTAYVDNNEIPNVTRFRASQ